MAAYPVASLHADRVRGILLGDDSTSLELKEMQKRRLASYAAELEAQIREKEERRQIERQNSLRQSQELLTLRKAAPSGLPISYTVGASPADRARATSNSGAQLDPLSWQNERSSKPEYDRSRADQSSSRMPGQAQQPPPGQEYLRADSQRDGPGYHPRGSRDYGGAEGSATRPDWQQPRAGSDPRQPGYPSGQEDSRSNGASTYQQTQQGSWPQQQQPSWAQQQAHPQQRQQQQQQYRPEQQQQYQQDQQHQQPPAPNRDQQYSQGYQQGYQQAAPQSYQMQGQQSYGSGPPQYMGSSMQPSRQNGQMGSGDRMGDTWPPGSNSPGLMATIGRQDGSRENATDARKAQYRAELLAQMRENEEAKTRSRTARIEEERRKEAEIARYDPWGRGGGGAPLRDETGSVVTDLSKLRKSQERRSPVAPPQHYVPPTTTSPPGQQYTAYSQAPQQRPGPEYSQDRPSPSGYGGSGSADARGYNASAGGAQGYGSDRPSQSNGAGPNVEPPRGQGQSPQRQGYFGGVANGNAPAVGSVLDVGHDASPYQRVPVHFRGDNAYMLPSELAAKQRAAAELQDSLKRQIEEKEARKRAEVEALKRQEEAEEARLQAEQDRLARKFQEEQSAERTKRASEAAASEAVERAWIEAKVPPTRSISMQPRERQQQPREQQSPQQQREQRQHPQEPTEAAARREEHPSSQARPEEGSYGRSRSPAASRAPLPASPEAAAVAVAAAAAREVASSELSRLRLEMATESAKMREVVEKQQTEVAALMRRAAQAEEELARVRSAGERDRERDRDRDRASARGPRDYEYGYPRRPGSSDLLSSLDYPAPAYATSRQPVRIWQSPQPGSLLDEFDLPGAGSRAAGGGLSTFSATNPGDYGAALRDSMEALLRPLEGGTSPQRGQASGLQPRNAAASNGPAVDQSLAAESRLIYPAARPSQPAAPSFAAGSAARGAAKADVSLSHMRPPMQEGGGAAAAAAFGGSMGSAAGWGARESEASWMHSRNGAVLAGGGFGQGQGLNGTAGQLLAVEGPTSDSLSSLDFDALVAQNEIRLKLLQNLEEHKGDPDSLDNFLAAAEAAGRGAARASLAASAASLGSGGGSPTVAAGGGASLHQPQLQTAEEVSEMVATVLRDSRQLLDFTDREKSLAADSRFLKSF